MKGRRQGAREERHSVMVTADSVTETAHRSGFVSIIGRPNCGKSTLLNRILGRKVTIVTPKPQTTRTRILGIKTLANAQLMLVDTPGMHRAKDIMNRRMVEVARRELGDADVVLWLVDAGAGERGVNRDILNWVRGRRGQACVALNKIDVVRKPDLLPLMDLLGRELPGTQIVPVSALTGENLDTLIRVLEELLPEGPPHYPAEEFTDQTERAMAQEIIREKVLIETREEVPYSVAVTVDAFEEKPQKNLVVIQAAIHVNRSSQKPIVLGAGGSRIKRIGQAARQDLERELGRRVYLELFVRVDAGWTADVRRLRELGL